MSHHEAMKEAIRQEGAKLQKRVDWLQTIMSRQSEAVLKIQGTIEQLRLSHEAANMALDALREDYRKLDSDDS